MADLTIDTTSGAYQQYLTGFGVDADSGLRGYLKPSFKALRNLPKADQLDWLNRDPLLRRFLKVAREVAGIIDEELSD